MVSCVCCAADSDSPDTTQVETREKSVCLRLGHLINAFHEMVQSAIPVGACVETMLKAIARLYGTLVLFAKYVRALPLKQITL